MPHTKLMKIITGQKDLRLNIFEVLDKYLFTTGLDPETWQEAVNKYLTEKYSNNVLDFGDMDFQFLMLITQHKKLRDKLHSRIEHIIQDECQDASCNQFLTCILSDKESYEDFERK
jgi:superfamily I DNA/RNA helicase